MLLTLLEAIRFCVMIADVMDNKSLIIFIAVTSFILVASVFVATWLSYRATKRKLEELQKDVLASLDDNLEALDSIGWKVETMNASLDDKEAELERLEKRVGLSESKIDDFNDKDNQTFKPFMPSQN
jgi:peptidoglycan hydrolase CwlO-like protein